MILQLKLTILKLSMTSVQLIFLFAVCFHGLKCLTILYILIQDSTGNNIQHPCYPVGFNMTVTEEFIFGSECTKELRSAGYSPQRNMTIIGAGDAAECRKAVRRIFDLNSCDSQNCSFNGVYQPPVSGQFMVGLQCHIVSKYQCIGSQSQSSLFIAQCQITSG